MEFHKLLAKMRLAVLIFLISSLLGCAGLPAKSGVAASASLLAANTALPPTYPAGEYKNPLRIVTQSAGAVESCPDPAIIRSQTPGDDAWYLYCTNERFSDHG